MNKRPVAFALAILCVLTLGPGLAGQVKTQQQSPNKLAKPVPKPEIPLAKCDLVAVSIEFIEIKSHIAADGTKRYSCIPKYTYKNSGPQPSGTFEVIFEIQNPVTKEFYFYLTWPYQTSLAAGEVRSFGGALSDECTWAATAERPTFRLRVDIGGVDDKGVVEESNEDNNVLVKQVSLLQLQNVRDVPLKKIVK